MVAELEGEVVGFMIGHVMTFSFGLEKRAWIATMGVEPKYIFFGSKNIDVFASMFFEL